MNKSLSKDIAVLIAEQNKIGRQIISALRNYAKVERTKKLQKKVSKDVFKWVDKKNHKRGVILGKSILSVAEWCKVLGHKNDSAVYMRIHYGWDINKALRTPIRFRSK